MTDIRFDQQRAQAAVQALSDTAALLRSITNARVDNANKALAHWTGPHASRFRQHDLGQLTKEAATIVSALDTLRASIEAAQSQASRDLFRQSHAALPDGKVLPG